jgi:hypothetical protein
MAKAAEEMLTSAKWAEKFGVSPNAFKKAMTELAIQPDMKKGVCGYYSEATANKIKAKIK